MNEAAQAEKNSVEPTKRTPEVVLRAMLRAYVDAATRAEVRYLQAARCSEDEAEASEERDMLWDAAESIRGELSWLTARGALCAFLEWPEWVGDDYRARLRGEWPLDAPPLEVP